VDYNTKLEKVLKTNNTKEVLLYEYKKGREKFLALFIYTGYITSK